MASDLKVVIDGVRLNVRVGAILRNGEDVVIEVSRVGANSVVPGGRIQINEKSSSALVRELKEEMNLEIKENKLKLVKVFENFYNMAGQDSHEIYFLYEYVLNDTEVKHINNIEQNFDNNTTFFKFVNKFELEKYNVLPYTLYELIQS